MRISIFNHFPGDDNTGGPVMTLSTTDLHKERASTEIETAVFETFTLFLEFPHTENPDVNQKISRVTLPQLRM